jgi:hypothetical protein
MEMENNVNPDPLRYEVFTVNSDLGGIGGKDDYYMDGDELVAVVTDYMRSATVYVSDEDTRISIFAQEEYPAMVQEAIDFLEDDLGLEVRQLQEKDYARIDNMSVVQ